MRAKKELKKYFLQSGSFVIGGFVLLIIFMITKNEYALWGAVGAFSGGIGMFIGGIWALKKGNFDECIVNETDERNIMLRGKASYFTMWTIFYLAVIGLFIINIFNIIIAVNTLIKWVILSIAIIYFISLMYYANKY